METVPEQLPVIARLGGRHGALRTAAAAAALAVIWTALWAWLVLGVAAPASASVRHISELASPAAELSPGGTDLS